MFKGYLDSEAVHCVLQGSAASNALIGICITADLLDLRWVGAIFQHNCICGGCALL